MYVVGLTGGIGSGKSRVAGEFASLGIPVVDADQASRAVVRPGMPALAAIAAHFGAGVLNRDGTLNRAHLREQVFADAVQRQWLEALLHPLIEEQLRLELAAVQGSYALLVSPLLLESGQHTLADRILVVDTPEEMQVQRTVERDGVPEQQVRAIMAAQMGRAQRRQAADEVLDNSGEPEQMRRQVRELHRRYLQLAARAGD